MKNAIKLAFVYIGLIIGAGFASGQEIMQFFLVYGAKSIYGIIIAGLLFTLTGVSMYYKTCAVSARTLREYFGCKPWNTVVEWIIILFMVSSYIVMVAGSGAIFEEHLSLPYLLGVINMTIICAVVFIKGARGIVAINMILTPLMILGIIITGVYMLIFKVVPSSTFGNIIDNWYVSSLLYVSYNIITAVVVITALQSLITSKRVAVLAGCIGGGILSAMLLILWSTLHLNYELVKDSQIPLLVIAGSLKWFYIPVFYMALITTAISSGFGVIQNISIRLNIKKHWCIILLCLIGFIGSFGGFTYLVSKLYSGFGYIGLFIMLYIIVDGFRCICSRNEESRQK